MSSLISLSAGCAGRSHTPKGKWIKNTRWSLLKSPDKQTVPQLALLGEVQQANKAMFRTFLLKEELRLLYALEDRALAPGAPRRLAGLGLALAATAVRQARAHDPPPPRRHPRRDPTRAIQNGRLEGLNSRIRLISHRSFGFHSAAPLIALVYLSCSGIVIDLPR